MNRIYYVIVNLTNLCYTKDGQDEQSIINADKFESYIEAKAKLAEYNDDLNGAIYEVKECLARKLRRVQLDVIIGKGKNKNE